MKIRALIVDDEPLGRERTRRLLGYDPDVEVVGECPDGPSAVAAIGELTPDVVFLDVRMPDRDGFAVVAELDPKTMPAIVFVTGFETHAVAAFEARAVDYLLKPTSRERVAEALRRVRERLSSKEPDRSRALLDLLADHGLTPGRMTRLPVRTNEGVTFVPTESVDRVEAAGNYVILHVGKTTHILRETMAAMESKLPGAAFLRVSRSAIVNLKRVRELRTTATGDHEAVLADGTSVPVTRSIREVEQRMQFS